MSSFCVYGMTELLARQMAEERTGWRHPTERRDYTREERDAVVETKAGHIFTDYRARQISPEFDAPQFAHDWLGVAERCTSVRGVQIMARGEKRDALGNVVISKVTKHPVITWVPYVFGGGVAVLHALILTVGFSLGVLARELLQPLLRKWRMEWQSH